MKKKQSYGNLKKLEAKSDRECVSNTLKFLVHWQYQALIGCFWWKFKGKRLSSSSELESLEYSSSVVYSMQQKYFAVSEWRLFILHRIIEALCIVTSSWNSP